MIERHLMKLRRRDEISAAEEQALRDTIGDAVEYPAERVIIRAGEELDHSTLLVDGLLARFKDLSNGQRQITHIHIPGDFADLHGFTLKRLDHHVMTLTPCRIARAPHVKLAAITDRFPHLTRIFWLSTNIDASIHREWIVSLGRRRALERTAHFFCELWYRMRAVELTTGHRYPLPITQPELAECLGLTAVHVNRVLRQLREQRIVDFRSGRVDIRDLARLEAIAEFDPLYLYLERRPR